MKLSRIFKTVFAFFWVLSVLWIMIGSLVNFHEYKIWKHPLNPQLIANKRDKEKVFSIQKLYKLTFHKDNDPLASFTKKEFAQSDTEWSGSIRIENAQLRIIPFTYSSGLRAPPLS